MTTECSSNSQLAQLIINAEHSSTRLMLTTEMLSRLIEVSDSRGLWLGQVLVEDGIMTDDELAGLLSSALNLPLLDITKVCPDPAVLAFADIDFCRQHHLVPMIFSDGSLHIAMANPLDESAIDHFKYKVVGKMEIAVVSLAAVDAAIPALYEMELPTGEVTHSTAGSDEYQIIHQCHASMYSLTSDNEEAYEVRLFELLKDVVDRYGSDLHLTAGSQPLMRSNGTLVALPYSRMKYSHVVSLVNSILQDEHRAEFCRNLNLDIAFTVSGIGRFRANIFQQRGSVCAIFRNIPQLIPTLSSLRMPQVLYQLCALERGLVLVTGTTGSGKSTTLAAMINEMNFTRHLHIMTLEDPIEYIHWHRKCEVNQRQIGADVRSFSEALQHVRRQDPDVILISELRDLSTIAAAITAAEAGHLVLASLPTVNALQTIDRIIEAFPPEQQGYIHMQLATVLEAVISQTLVPQIDGKGRVCAQEILVATPAVRAAIRGRKLAQLSGIMDTGAQFGMQTLDKTLSTLVRNGIITQEEAQKRSACQQVITE